MKLYKSQRFVKNCIVKYKTLVKNQIEAQIAERAHNGRVVNDSMIDEIDDYWWKKFKKISFLQFQSLEKKCGKIVWILIFLDIQPLLRY